MDLTPTTHTDLNPVERLACRLSFTLQLPSSVWGGSLPGKAPKQEQGLHGGARQACRALLFRHGEFVQ